MCARHAALHEPRAGDGRARDHGRSDVYALGCVLYEMLDGEPPFTGPTAQAIIARVMTEEPRRSTLQRKTIPPHVEAAVAHARWRSCRPTGSPPRRSSPRRSSRPGASTVGHAAAPARRGSPGGRCTRAGRSRSRRGPSRVLALGGAAWGWRGRSPRQGTSWQYITFGDGLVPAPGPLAGALARRRPPGRAGEYPERAVVDQAPGRAPRRPVAGDRAVDHPGVLARRPVDRVPSPTGASRRSGPAKAGRSRSPIRPPTPLGGAAWLDDGTWSTSDRASAICRGERGGAARARRLARLGAGGLRDRSTSRRCPASRACCSRSALPGCVTDERAYSRPPHRTPTPPARRRGDRLVPANRTSALTSAATARRSRRHSISTGWNHRAGRTGARWRAAQRAASCWPGPRGGRSSTCRAPPRRRIWRWCG